MNGRSILAAIFLSKTAASREDSPMNETGSDLVTVFKAAGEFEAQQVKTFLEANGIACLLRGEALRNTHGFTLDGLGVVKVEVAAEDEENARELLRRAEAGEIQLEESDYNITGE